MKTKVMYLLNHLNIGGAETLITEYALKINKEKFEIIIVTTSRHNNSINEIKLANAGINVVFLGDNDIFPISTNIINRIFNTIKRYILFSRIIRKEQPDIVHTHLGTNVYVFPINFKKKNIKLFHTIHSEVKVNFKKKYQKLITKYCINHKKMIPIALHSKMQREANNFFDTDTCIVVPNGIDMKRFIDINVNKQRILSSLNIKQDAFIIGHVGRFTASKNHKFLIDLFSKVKQRQSNAHLILVGEGKLENQIKDYVRQLGIQDNVSFLGNRGDIPELMSIMEVFVFPSLYEGFGNVLIEAQAARVKCVVSNTIPSDALVSNIVTPLSLEGTMEKWTHAIVNNDSPKEFKGSLLKHDINIVIEILENIYLDTIDI